MVNTAATQNAPEAVSLQVNLSGLTMKNPVTVASGIFANGREYSDLWQNRFGQTAPAASAPAAPALSALGALTTKGVSLKPWTGNPGIRIAETASGMLNSIGLQNPGVEAFCAKELPWLAEQNVPVIVNVSGHSVREYASVIERLEEELATRYSPRYGAQTTQNVPIAAYEVNISCPNVECGGMSFGTDPEAAEQVVLACRESLDKYKSRYNDEPSIARSLIVKLTPNVTDITEIARSCEAAGADALSLVNTVAGMAIDLKRRTPVFQRVVAGLSGPAIKPIALYAIYRVYQAVNVPLLGIGGITSGEDVIEFMLAGATAIAVGTANFADPLAALRIISEIEEWCVANGVSDVNELIGALK